MKTPLSGSRESLFLPLLVSVVGHGGMLVGFAGFTFLMTFCGDPKPIIDPDDTMQVAMVELAKSKTKMPDRATRAPKAVGSPTPEPAPTPPVEKHNSDLSVKVEKAEPKPGVDTKRLEDALAKLERDEAEADMAAALGQLDQAATDPDSTAEQGATIGTVGNPGDPEYARYIAKVRAIFLENFQVIPTIRDANPGVKCTVQVKVDPTTGKVLGATVSRPSGVAAFDAAALRAAQSVESVPMPPEKYKALAELPYLIDFT